jgi:protein O-mannosyl-transferase
MKTEYDNLTKSHPDFAKSLLICIFITASLLTIYMQALQHEFINYDDNEYVFENRLVQQGLTPKTILKAFSVETAGNWHPITILSHMLDCHIHGLKAGRHILTNILLHTLNSILLFLLMKKMTGYLWETALVAMLFALHPIHVESVAWVSERKDLLSMLFWLLTVWSYARYVNSRGAKNYFLIFIFLSLGLMTKPMLVTLPFVLLLFDFWPLNRYKASNTSILSLLYEKIPLFIPVIASCILTLKYQKAGSAVKSLLSYPLHIRIENAVVAYVTYIGKIFCPINLSVFYPHPGKPAFWQVATSLSILALITFLSLYYHKKRPWLFSGWFLFTGMLVPVIGLVQVGSQALADRYTYIPSIGIFIMIVWAGAEFISSCRYKKTILAVSIPIIISILLLLSRQQTGYWKNSTTLFKHALEVTEQNYLAHNNLGLALKQKGRTLEAIKHYQKSLLIQPGYVLAHNNLGVALLETGKTREAVNHFSLAIKLMPDFIESHINLASSLLDMGEPEKAAEQCRKAIKLNPNKNELFIVFGDSLSALGEIDEAAIQYKKALKLNSDSAKAHNHFGAFLIKNNKIDKALFHFKAAAKINPDDENFKANLKTTIQAKNRLESAIEKKVKQLQKKPIDPASHTELGHLYKKIGDIDAGLTHHKKALAIDPDFIPALNALAFDHAAKKEYDSSVLLLKKILTIDSNKPDTYFNIACIYAKQDKVREAVSWLQKAVEKGYNNWELIKSDKDLDNIRNTPGFNSLLDQQAN